MIPEREPSRRHSREPTLRAANQQMIQAPRSGENVEVSPMWMWGPIQFFARPN